MSISTDIVDGSVMMSFFFRLNELFYPLLGWARVDFRVGVEQPFAFGCLIVHNCQAVQSMGRSMNWTMEDDMIDVLFFCATPTDRRGSHTPFLFCTSRSRNVRHRGRGSLAGPRLFLRGSFQGCVPVSIWN